MKKNTMMRLASFLLIAVLISTSAISGTYAKYVTQDSASDSARVAKWGVEVAVDGTLFSDSYYGATSNLPANYTANETQSNITVQAVAEGTKVVAPGTKNNKGITFELSGAPEVDTKVEVEIDYTDIVLPMANIANATEDYHPVKFTLKAEGVDTALVTEGTLEQVVEKLEELDGTYHTNTDLAKKFGDNATGKYTLTWEWPFEENDVADTLLGDIAAGKESLPTGASIDISLDVTITVTQID